MAGKAAIMMGAGLLSSSIVFSANVARADDAGLTISEAWVRMIIPQRPAAGYFKLANAGDTEQALTAASSPACGSIMLHKSVTVDGADKMEMVMKVAVPAHGTLEFAPHGYHLMCMQPSADIKPGASVPVILNFESGAALTAEFAVKGATGE
jgi:copper(I)-binding protein